MEGTELGFANTGVSDSGFSGFVKISKLLLEDGILDEGEVFFGTKGGFLLCLFLLATLVNPSGSKLLPFSVGLGGMFKGQSRKR